MVEVHYRWHALYGRRFRQESIAQRAHGRVVWIEVSAGEVMLIPAWMLDPAACAGMRLGAPRVSVAALVELHDLLIGRGFGRAYPGGPTIPEAHHEALPSPTRLAVPVRQLSMPLDSPKLRGMAPAERAIAIAKLASLLTAAAGLSTGGHDDEER